MKIQYSHKRTPLFVGVGFLLLIILAEYAAIMILNNGMLTYTLDDPYIHLELSENIMEGHYGVNQNEFSAPSSSILWPFIIAPFSNFEYFPFLVNIMAAIATVLIFIKILQIMFGIYDNPKSNFLISSFLILLILATNIVGLIFTGMEHSLQLLTVAVIVYGLILEIEKNKVAPWFLIAVIMAPLIRYENMAISLTAIGYLFIRKYFKHSVLVVSLLLLSVGGFSLFLTSLGLNIFPSSVAVKSSLVGSEGKLQSIVSNLINSFLLNRQGLVLLLGVTIFFSYALYAKTINKKQLAIVSIFAVLMHFIAGQYGWYNRYEIYIWSFVLLISLYFLSPQLKKLLIDRNINMVKAVSVAACLTVFIGAPYILGLGTLPIAANNIYEQQYQMHRFAVDFYDKPVAVNDLGYVSYKNDNYVLDFLGIASTKILHYRKNSDNDNWMSDISNKYNIGLAMIYEDWFRNIPDEWIKIGELHIGKRSITLGGNAVVFYATNPTAYSEIVQKLQPFIKTLPSDVKFTFQKSSS